MKDEVGLEGTVGEAVTVWRFAVALKFFAVIDGDGDEIGLEEELEIELEIKASFFVKLWLLSSLSFLRESLLLACLFLLSR